MKWKIKASRKRVRFSWLSKRSDPREVTWSSSSLIPLTRLGRTLRLSQHLRILYLGRMRNWATSWLKLHRKIALFMSSGPRNRRLCSRRRKSRSAFYSSFPWVIATDFKSKMMNSHWKWKYSVVLKMCSKRSCCWKKVKTSRKSWLMLASHGGRDCSDVFRHLYQGVKSSPTRHNSIFISWMYSSIELWFVCADP